MRHVRIAMLVLGLGGCMLADPQRRPDDQRVRGVRGQVIDERGAPLAGVMIWLVTPRIGLSMPPLQPAPWSLVGQAVSDSMGGFAIRIAGPVQPVELDLSIRSERRVEVRVRDLQIAAAGWTDVGQIRLVAGISVEGTVTRQDAAHTRVAGATVCLRDTKDLAWIPGREPGLVTSTDATGRFRIEGAPDGLVQVSARADGCVAEQRVLTLMRDTENRCDFELGEGRWTIRGVIVGPRNEPVAGARIGARGDTPHTEVFSGRDGRFEIHGLAAGSYPLHASAIGFASAWVDAVEAGAEDARILLQRLGAVNVRAFGKTGEPLDEYTVAVQRVLGDKQSWFVATNPKLRVSSPNGASIDGLEPGDYRLGVEASGHARGFSAPLTIRAGQDPQLLTVRLDEGGVIEGVVRGKDGMPLPDVTVDTRDGELEANPFLEGLFGDRLSTGATRTMIKTMPGGRYRIALLTPGRYRLEFSHAEHGDLEVRDLDLVAGRTLQVPDLTLPAGTRVVGVVAKADEPAARFSVTLYSVPDSTRPEFMRYRGTIVTERDGRFSFPRRLPPGRFRLEACLHDEALFRFGPPAPRAIEEFEIGGSGRELVVRLATWKYRW